MMLFHSAHIGRKNIYRYYHCRSLVNCLRPYRTFCS